MNFLCCAGQGQDAPSNGKKTKKKKLTDHVNERVCWNV